MGSEMCIRDRLSLKKFTLFLTYCYSAIYVFILFCNLQAVQALMNMGTASGVEHQVTGPKVAGPPAFTPAPSDSTNLQPLPKPPLPQILQEPDFKELDDLEGYNKFADVLQ